MKDLADIQDRLKLELIHWFLRQCRNVYEDYYLWFHPTTAESNGALMIAKDKPNNPNGAQYELVMPEQINKGMTVEQNFLTIINRGFLNRLPILEY